MERKYDITPERARLIRVIHVGKRELGMNEDDYRRFLQRCTGKRSCNALSDTQLRHVRDEMKRRGFHVKPKARSKPASKAKQPRINKITALWCSLADAGAVKNRSQEAMEAWCKSMTNGRPLAWAESNELNNCIEALKSWCVREGVRCE